MTFFGWLLVAILSYILFGYWRAKRKYIELPPGADRLVFILGLILIGILTIGTGSLIKW